MHLNKLALQAFTIVWCVILVCWVLTMCQRKTLNTVLTNTGLNVTETVYILMITFAGVVDSASCNSPHLLNLTSK